MAVTVTPYGLMVRRARVCVGMSMKEMADWLGCSPNFLSIIETGRKKVPMLTARRVQFLLADRGVLVPDIELAVDLTNNRIDLSELTWKQSAVASRVAHAHLTDEQADELMRIARRMTDENGIALCAPFGQVETLPEYWDDEEAELKRKAREAEATGQKIPYL